ncbi:MAG: 1-acyl-sn-glycerol-3-phosphate acyltransferase, partial [Actinomycetota bacterium]|nr:1-acyl-sn-glycerol-3-phosphate acyltransferase [Actinomycetota bacterium]
MGDADVIPIGTRGRPGRGTGSPTPSKSARSLVGQAQKKRAPRKQAQPATSSPETEVLETAAPVADGEGGKSRPPVYTQPRLPGHASSGPGIPVAEVVNAVTRAAREAFGDQWEPRVAELLAFCRRRVTGDYVVDDYGFDPEVTQRFLLAAMRPIAQRWFRIEVRGAENIPTEGGALVVSNHSGTIPVDGLMTMVSIHDHTQRFLRPLGADLVFKTPVVSDLARKSGATLACNDDAERMLRDGELVGVWPEGFKGIGKPYAERYKLQRFGRG